MNGIPDTIASFIMASIESVDQLEVLLLLWRHPEQYWTATATSTELRTSDLGAQLTLEHLRSKKLVEVDAANPPGYRFPSTNFALCELVDALSRCYAERRVAIITLIYSKPGPDKDPVQIFAEAFRLIHRKDGKNG